MLYLALGIIGATVMPHNLYLHSGIVQTRAYGETLPERREAMKFATIDSTVALMFALTINASILILAAAAFNKTGKPRWPNSARRTRLLSPLLGSAVAPTLFGIALLCCGLNSTVTATMAGQIVMEGFLDIRLPPWLRRLVTRSGRHRAGGGVTIWYGESGTAQAVDPVAGDPEPSAPLRHHPARDDHGESRQDGRARGAPLADGARRDRCCDRDRAERQAASSTSSLACNRRLEASVEARLGRVGGREPSRMGGDEVSLDLAALFGRFNEEVDMHLVRAAFRALVAQVSEIEARRLVAGLPEGERGAGSVLVAANEDVVGSRQGRAADQAIDTVEIAPSRSATPIMEGLGEIGSEQTRAGFVASPHYWRGAWGRRYLHIVYSLIGCPALHESQLARSPLPRRNPHRARPRADPRRDGEPQSRSPAPPGRRMQRERGAVSTSSPKRPESAARSRLTSSAAHQRGSRPPTRPSLASTLALQASVASQWENRRAA